MDPRETWFDRVRHDLPAQLTYQDGLVGAMTDDGQWVLTSPNVTFVPQPVLDHIRVEVRSDGRYGVEDPIQWPQFFSRMYSHYPLILRRPADPNDDRQPIWWNPTKHDFIPIHGSAVSCLGTLAAQPRERLGRLVENMSSRISSFAEKDPTSNKYINFCNLSMRAAFNCLTFPSTYRDLVVQVSNVQRYWLESNAMLEYLGNHNERFLNVKPVPPPADSSFMGAYTSDPVAAFKLFTAGIPVWLIRASHSITSDVSVAELLLLSRPRDIETKSTGFGQLVYMGHVGERHHAAVSKGAHTYMDIPKIFLSFSNTTQGAAQYQEQLANSQLNQSTATSSSRPTNSRPSRPQKVSKVCGRQLQAPYRRDKRPSKSTSAEIAVSQRDKFVEESHLLFPPPIPVWTESLAQVNRQVAALGRIDYFVPEPALLVGPSSRPPKVRHFRNWLKGRDPWMHIITHPVFRQEPIHQQWWRNYLNHDNLDEAKDGTTHTAKQKAEVLELFAALSSGEKSDTPHDNVQFYGRSFPLDPLNTQLCKEVVWEVFEMGFRLELWALDRHMCPSSSQSPQEQQVTEYLRLDLISKIFGGAGHIRLAHLPTTNGGLAAVDVKERVPALEAFRSVLVRWPGSPVALQQRISTSLSHQQVEEVERSAVKFYLEQFYIHSSRAAIVPHRFPV